jgi:hypothetical protein
VATAASSSSDDDAGSGLRTRTQCTTSCSTNDLTITSIHEGRWFNSRRRFLVVDGAPSSCMYMVCEWADDRLAVVGWEPETSCFETVTGHMTIVYVWMVLRCTDKCWNYWLGTSARRAVFFFFWKRAVLLWRRKVGDMGGRVHLKLKRGPLPFRIGLLQLQLACTELATQCRR